MTLNSQLVENQVLVWHSRSVFLKKHSRKVRGNPLVPSYAAVGLPPSQRWGLFQHPVVRHSLRLLPWRLDPWLSAGAQASRFPA